MMHVAPLYTELSTGLQQVEYGPQRTLRNASETCSSSLMSAE